jgi:hypothetical protein
LSSYTILTIALRTTQHFAEQIEQNLRSEDGGRAGVVIIGRDLDETYDSAPRASPMISGLLS